MVGVYQVLNAREERKRREAGRDAKSKGAGGGKDKEGGTRSLAKPPPGGRRKKVWPGGMSSEKGKPDRGLAAHRIVPRSEYHVDIDAETLMYAEIAQV